MYAIWIFETLYQTPIKDIRYPFSFSLLQMEKKKLLRFVLLESLTTRRVKITSN